MPFWMFEAGDSSRMKKGLRSAPMYRARAISWTLVESFASTTSWWMIQNVLGFAVEPWAGLGVAQSRDQDLNTCDFAWSAPAPAMLKAKIPIAASAATPQLPILTFGPPIELIALPARRERGAICRDAARVASPRACPSYSGPTLPSPRDARGGNPWNKIGVTS